MLSIVFGVLVPVQPAAGALAAGCTIGAYALLFGVTLIAMAFRVRSFGKRLQARAVV